MTETLPLVNTLQDEIMNSIHSRAIVLEGNKLVKNIVLSPVLHALTDTANAQSSRQASALHSRLKQLNGIEWLPGEVNFAVREDESTGLLYIYGYSEIQEATVCVMTLARKRLRCYRRPSHDFPFIGNRNRRVSNVESVVKNSINFIFTEDTKLEGYESFSAKFIQALGHFKKINRILSQQITLQ